jgi:hypothetical protein
MSYIPIVDGRKECSGYWVSCIYCRTPSGRPRIHVHKHLGVQQAPCSQQHLRPEWRGRELLYDVRDEAEHAHTGGVCGS